MRVCLERVVELAGARLRLRDWPGAGGPLVHVPDPLAPDDTLVMALAERLAPRFRVLSLTPRGSSAYQLDADELRATLDQFGFERPVLAAEGLGCVAALLVSAWHPDRVAGLVLISPTYDAPPGGGQFARALKDCPPHWATLRDAVACPVLVPAAGSALDEIDAFLGQLGPGVA